MSTDLSGLDRFLKKLSVVEDLVSTQDTAIKSEIVDGLTSYGADFLEKQYSELTLDETSSNPIPSVVVAKQKNCGIINAVGSGVAYIEFGTGSVGSQSANAETRANKAKVGALPYNSGRKIRLMTIRVGTDCAYKYTKKLAWVKPDSAATPTERGKLAALMATLAQTITNGKALKRAYKRNKAYVLTTQGIKAGMQIYRTARRIEKKMPSYTKQIIRKYYG